MKKLAQQTFQKLLKETLVDLVRWVRPRFPSMPTTSPSSSGWAGRPSGGTANTLAVASCRTMLSGKKAQVCMEASLATSSTTTRTTAGTPTMWSTTTPVLHPCRTQMVATKGHGTVSVRPCQARTDGSWLMRTLPKKLTRASTARMVPTLSHAVPGHTLTFRPTSNLKKKKLSCSRDEQRLLDDEEHGLHQCLVRLEV